MRPIAVEHGGGLGGSAVGLRATRAVERGRSRTRRQGLTADVHGGSIGTGPRASVATAEEAARQVRGHIFYAKRRND
jgi:hypothetical protein